MFATQVAHEKLQEEKPKYQDIFRVALASKLPNIDTFSDAVLENVLNTLLEKFAIQEYKNSSLLQSNNLLQRKD